MATHEVYVLRGIQTAERTYSIPSFVHGFRTLFTELNDEPAVLVSIQPAAAIHWHDPRHIVGVESVKTGFRPWLSLVK